MLNILDVALCVADCFFVFVFFFLTILPWYGFGEYVFAFAIFNLVLVDWIGGRCICSLKFGVDPNGELACKLSLGS
jgi:hypothetical protein